MPGAWESSHYSGFIFMLTGCVALRYNYLNKSVFVEKDIKGKD